MGAGSLCLGWAALAWLPRRLWWLAGQMYCAGMTARRGGSGLEGVDMLITSPGIAHLYPKPHPAIALAMQLGIPLDNDIGLFFRSFATSACSWAWMRSGPMALT